MLNHYAPEAREILNDLLEKYASDGDARNLEIPTPPLAEQPRIVAELDALQAKVDALKRLQAETAAQSNTRRRGVPEEEAQPYNVTAAATACNG
ncbi:MAG: hypothetical protein DME25_02405 [Verrucomicrobia bacterium]|nr:MAG: hypothetical protein DME25_02405 [Verrucomicrobiota bacterium]